MQICKNEIIRPYSVTTYVQVVGGGSRLWSGLRMRQRKSKSTRTRKWQHNCQATRCKHAHLKDFSEMTDKVKISSSFICLSDMYSETSENYRERFHFSSLDQLTQCSRVWAVVCKCLNQAKPAFSLMTSTKLSPMLIELKWSLDHIVPA